MPAHLLFGVLCMFVCFFHFVLTVIIMCVAQKTKRQVQRTDVSHCASIVLTDSASNDVSNDAQPATRQADDAAAIATLVTQPSTRSNSVPPEVYPWVMYE
jgi:hypothetical protein